MRKCFHYVITLISAFALFVSCSKEDLGQLKEVEWVQGNWKGSTYDFVTGEEGHPVYLNVTPTYYQLSYDGPISDKTEKVEYILKKEINDNGVEVYWIDEDEGIRFTNDPETKTIDIQGWNWDYTLSKYDKENKYEWLLGTWYGKIDRESLISQVDSYYSDFSEPPTESEIQDAINSVLDRIGTGECKVTITKDYLRYSIPLISSDFKKKYKYEIVDGLVEQEILSHKISYYEKAIYVDGEKLLDFDNVIYSDDGEERITDPFLICSIDLGEDLMIGSLSQIVVNLAKETPKSFWDNALVSWIAIIIIIGLGLFLVVLLVRALCKMVKKWYLKSKDGITTRIQTARERITEFGDQAKELAKNYSQSVSDGNNKGHDLQNKWLWTAIAVLAIIVFTTIKMCSGGNNNYDSSPSRQNTNSSRQIEQYDNSSEPEDEYDAIREELNKVNMEIYRRNQQIQSTMDPIERKALIADRDLLMQRASQLQRMLMGY